MTTFEITFCGTVICSNGSYDDTCVMAEEEVAESTGEILSAFEHATGVKFETADPHRFGVTFGTYLYVIIPAETAEDAIALATETVPAEFVTEYGTEIAWEYRSAEEVAV